MDESYEGRAQDEVWLRRSKVGKTDPEYVSRRRVSVVLLVLLWIVII